MGEQAHTPLPWFVGEMVEALKEIIAAHDEFRADLPPDWDGDPLSDQVELARGLLVKIGVLADE